MMVISVLYTFLIFTLFIRRSTFQSTLTLIRFFWTFYWLYLLLRSVSCTLVVCRPPIFFLYYNNLSLVKIRRIFLLCDRFLRCAFYLVFLFFRILADLFFLWIKANIPGVYFIKFLNLISSTIFYYFFFTIFLWF